MHHRTNVRAQTDVPVDIHADGYVFSCRAVDLSTSGVVVERAAGLEHHEARPFYWLRFALGAHGVVTLARPVWKRGMTQAFRFVEMSDEGRLTVAEHMDVASRVFGMALHLPSSRRPARLGRRHVARLVPVDEEGGLVVLEREREKPDLREQTAERELAAREACARDVERGRAVASAERLRDAVGDRRDDRAIARRGEEARDERGRDARHVARDRDHRISLRERGDEPAERTLPRREVRDRAESGASICARVADEGSADAERREDRGEAKDDRLSGRRDEEALREAAHPSRRAADEDRAERGHASARRRTSTGAPAGSVATEASMIASPSHAASATIAPDA